MVAEHYDEFLADPEAYVKKYGEAAADKAREIQAKAAEAVGATKEE